MQLPSPRSFTIIFLTDSVSLWFNSWKLADFAVKVESPNALYDFIFRSRRYALSIFDRFMAGDQGSHEPVYDRTARHSRTGCPIFAGTIFQNVWDHITRFARTT